MPIEANADIIAARASSLSGAAKELETAITRFLRARAYATEHGEAMPNALKQKAFTAAAGSAAQVNTAATALQAAWNSQTPITE